MQTRWLFLFHLLSNTPLLTRPTLSSSISNITEKRQSWQLLTLAMFWLCAIKLSIGWHVFNVTIPNLADIQVQGSQQGILNGGDHIGDRSPNSQQFCCCSPVCQNDWEILNLSPYYLFSYIYICVY
jgi:hypothetical protein